MISRDKLENNVENKQIEKDEINAEDGILPATVLFLREIWSTFFAIKNEILL